MFLYPTYFQTKNMSQDVMHAVLEGLDDSQSKGGLIIRKKPSAPSDDGFKVPGGGGGGSRLGLDKLAAIKERERKENEAAAAAKKRQLEQDSEDRESFKK